MSNSSSSSSSGGIGFTGLLTIAFIVLKLTNYIDWPWIWVLSPLWIGFAIFILIFIIVFVAAGYSSTSRINRTKRSLWQKRLNDLQNKNK